MAKKSTIPAEESAVRDAANALCEAISAAEAAGYRVQWPVHHRDLPAIAVSETGSRVRPASENVEVVEKTVEAPAERK